MRQVASIRHYIFDYLSLCEFIHFKYRCSYIQFYKSEQCCQFESKNNNFSDSDKRRKRKKRDFNLYYGRSNNVS